MSEARSDAARLSPSATRTQAWSSAATRALALGLILLALALFVASLPGRYAQLANPSSGKVAALAADGVSPHTYALYQLALEVALALGYVAIGSIVVWRRWRDWLAIYAAVVLTLYGTVFVTHTTEPLLLGDSPLRFPLYYLQALAQVGTLVLIYLFPDGRFVPRWTRIVAVLWAANVFGWVIFSNSSIKPNDPLSQPLAYSITATAFFLVGGYAQIYRYQHTSSLLQQQQTKWIVFGIVVAVITNRLFYIPGQMVSEIRLSGQVALLYESVGGLLFALGQMVLPVSFLLSVQRYRLWEIDVIINRTLVYVPLTAVLAGLYSASISLFQRLFTTLTGDKSDAAVVLTTLILASTFTPLKNGLQGFVDRRFRESVDSTRELKRFGEHVQSVVEVLQVERLASRLLIEATRAFRAESGEVHLVMKDGREITQVYGQRSDDCRLSVALSSEGLHSGTISLGHRLDSREYTAEDQRVLREVADAVCAALSLSRQTG